MAAKGSAVSQDAASVVDRSIRGRCAGIDENYFDVTVLSSFLPAFDRGTRIPLTFITGIREIFIARSLELLGAVACIINDGPVAGSGLLRY